MQYAYYVQFNTSFNTLEPIYVCIYVKMIKDYSVFGRTGVVDDDDEKKIAPKNACIANECARYISYIVHTDSYRLKNPQ